MVVRLAHLNLKHMLEWLPGVNRKQISKVVGMLEWIGFFFLKIYSILCRYRHIYTSNGLTLHDIAISLANGQSITTGVSDDMCAKCGEGGDLIFCESCPQAFHLGRFLVLSIIKFFSVDGLMLWFCIYFSCFLAELVLFHCSLGIFSIYNFLYTLGLLKLFIVLKAFSPYSLFGIGTLSPPNPYFSFY